MKILIVDDSRVIQKSIMRLVDGMDLEVIGTASDGKEALELFSSSEPDLVTMDITMPEMDGLSCLQEMVEIRPECRILIISALNDPSTGLKALKLGARGFINKPFTGEQLRSEILRIAALNQAQR